MSKKLKDALKQILLKFRFFSEWYYGRSSYSQEAEDLLIASLLGENEHEFYVDIGAHHPHRFSNTFYFYRRGWSGLNVDPLPGTKMKFDKMRPRDINVEMGCSDRKGSLTYFMFDEPAFNSINPETVGAFEKRGYPTLIGTKEIPVETLETILDRFLPKNQQITFLSIDVESLDYQVLKGNNWDKYSPKFIIVEDSSYSVNEPTPLALYLMQLGYQYRLRTYNNVIWQKT